MCDFFIYPKNQSCCTFYEFLNSKAFDIVNVEDNSDCFITVFKNDKTNLKISDFWWDTMKNSINNPLYENDLTIFIKYRFGKNFFSLLKHHIKRILTNENINILDSLKINNFFDFIDTTHKFIDEYLCDAYVCETFNGIIGYQEYESNYYIIASIDRQSVNNFLNINGIENGLSNYMQIQVEQNMAYNLLQCFPVDMNEKNIKWNYVSKESYEKISNIQHHCLGILKKIPKYLIQY